MLLYISETENHSYFDFLLDRKIIIKKLLGEIDFKKFVIHDMKNLDHYSHVLVDLEAINNSEDEIIEAITAFKMIYNPRLIIFSKNVDKLLLSRIANEGYIYDIIIGKNLQEIKNEMEKCLDKEDEFRDQVRRDIKKFNLKYSFKKDNVKIIVAGVKSILGTTKTAINLATFLGEIGASVSYTEVSKSGYLRNIASHYEFKNSSYKDIVFFENGDIPLDFNFNIINIGILKKENIKVFNSNDIGDARILCSSSKQSELEDLINILKLTSEDLNIVVKFNTNKEKRIGRKLLKDKSKLYFSDDSVSLFDTKNATVFKEILSRYIIENKIA